MATEAERVHRVLWQVVVPHEQGADAAPDALAPWWLSLVCRHAQQVLGSGARPSAAERDWLGAQTLQRLATEVAGDRPPHSSLKCGATTITKQHDLVEVIVAR